MQIETLEQLGALLRSARRDRDLTQEDVMFAAAVSKTFLIDVERGKPSCEFDKVLRVANVVGVRLTASGHDRAGEG